MRYLCLIVGCTNTLVSLLLVLLAAQSSFTPYILELFIFNSTCALVNISLWFTLAWAKFSSEAFYEFS